MSPKLSVESLLNLDLQINLVEIFLNGFYTAIFVLTVYGFYFGVRRVSMNHRFLMVSCTITMYLLSTTHAALHWYILWKGFVVHGESQAQIRKAITDQPFWMVTLGVVVFSFNTLIADCLFIWRCWVIWGNNWRVIIVPSFLTLVGTVFSVLADVAQITQITAAHSTSVLVTSKFFKQTGVIYLALSSATTILVTILITYRILQVHISNRKVFIDGGSRSSRIYSYALEILVESALLYTIAEISLLILLAKQDPRLFYSQSVVSQMTGIAPTLILLRISLGVARPTTTWSQNRSIRGIDFAFPTIHVSDHIRSESDPSEMGTPIGLDMINEVKLVNHHVKPDHR